MDEQTDKQSSILSGIIDGSVTIDSATEFNNLLRAFPNDPWPHRFFADYLKRDESFIAAADAYGTAAELFVKADMTLQAIVSKILEWRIQNPSYDEEQSFYSSIRESSSKNTWAKNFFIKMTYSEMMAFMSAMEVRHFPAGSTLKRFGDEEKDIYFIVSGVLEETIYRRTERGQKVQKKSTKTLVENEFFGEIYPFDEEKVSQSDIETITRVEFAKISKSRLMAICRKYPNVKIIIDGLYQGRSESDEEGFSIIVRRTVRHQLPTQVDIRIFSDEPSKAPLNLRGFTKDISLGGASVVLGVEYENSHFENLVGKKVKLQMYLAVAFVSLSFFGTIAWSKGISLEGKKTKEAGIQFERMADTDRRLLQSYHYGSEREQDLIWNLWDSLMEKQSVIIDDNRSN